MPLAKLSMCFLIVLTLIWSGWASVEAQEGTSPMGYSNQSYSSQSTTRVSQSIRVDRNLGRSGQTSFIVQEDDGPSGAEFDRDNDASETDGEPRRPSLLELDEEEDDLDQEQERRPTRPVFGPWPRKGIRSITIDIRDTSANVPEDVSQQLIQSNRYDWTQFRPQQKVFAWVAPDIKYQPLYFEDVALERYGTTAAPYHQSLISGFHFFKSFVLLPHQMRHDAPSSCDHPLGFCRPGNSTPYTIQRHYFGRPGR